MDISEMLLERQKSLFVGREKELSILNQALNDARWQLFNIHGQGGIGKTTLIRLFALTIGSTRCLYFDGHSGFQRPNDFLQKLMDGLSEKNQPSIGHFEEVTSILNDYANKHQGIFLILDTFEQWGAIENWLRDQWFPTLSPMVKVLIAGRNILDGQWLRNGWNLLLHNIELLPLSSADVHKYAVTRGIHNRLVSDSLQRFSGGVPLAMSMACEIIARKGTANFLNHPEQKQIIGYLVAELTQNINEQLKKYIEVASVVWRFDQDLLQFLLQEEVSTEQFREFCRLPFVISQEQSWSLHDAVRQWTFTDLRYRMPQTFRDYQKRALKALRIREQEHPERKSDLSFEKVYLHESDFVRNFCFQSEDSLTIRECSGEELEQVERLYSDYLHNQPNYIPDEVHLEELIRPLWEIDSSAFIGMWYEDRIVAFCSCIPLNQQTIQLFSENPITHSVTKLYDPNQRLCIICLAGVETQLENEISGSVARAMAKIIDRNTYIINLISMPKWASYLPLLGFERIPWADSSTPKGVVYQAFHLDLRNEDFPARVDRMFAAMVQTRPYSQVETKPIVFELKLNLEDAVKFVQRTLKHFSQLPLDPDIIHSLRSMMHNQLQDMDSEILAHQLQHQIRNILHSFSSGTEQERQYSQILHYAYIHKIGTHESVAEYLNLSVPTYYRYLRTSIRKLAYELISK